MAKRGIWSGCCVSSVLLLIQSCQNAPTSDEVGNLVSGVATVQTGDTGFYRVNPPFHRLFSGIAVEVWFSPDLRGIYPASMMISGARQEFMFAKSVIAAHANEYPLYFYVGRLIRLPVILFASWLLVSGMIATQRLAAGVAASLWLSSPMVLGHGWAIMPDAFSGVAMVLLLVSTLSWLRTRDWLDFVAVGIAWGLAIGTKFTFCPIYLLWPLALISHQWSMGKLNWRSLYRLTFCHLGHGVIALVIVIGLYGAVDVGVPLIKHSFQSQRLVQLTQSIGWLPSPFPMQFLVGIDEQQLDLEKGYPTYFLGNWYPDGVWWYYLVGILVKEQLVFLIGLGFVVVGGVRLFGRDLCRMSGIGFQPVSEETQAESLCHSVRSLALTAGNYSTDDKVVAEGSSIDRQSEQEVKACFVFCLLAAAMVLGVLSMHSRMALNVRYAFPALPPLYLAIGIGVTTTFAGKPIWLRRVVVVMGAIVICELAANCPHYFAYANPLFGGSYRVPPVLHDSNFDGGQDLWRLENWLQANPVANGKQRYTCVHSHVPESAFKFVPNPPTPEILQQIIATRQTGKHSSPATDTIEIIVMRGLGVPAPWTTLCGPASPQIMPLFKELLQFPPDEFITPTLAIYRAHVSPDFVAR